MVGRLPTNEAIFEGTMSADGRAYRFMFGGFDEMQKYLLGYVYVAPNVTGRLGVD